MQPQQEVTATETAVKPQRRITTQSPQKRPTQAETPSELAMLTGRLTVVQEQLLQLKSQTAEMQQQNQALLIHIQSIKDSLNTAAQTPIAEENNQQANSEDFNSVLDQLTLLANELGTKVQDGPYRISSDYTAKGQWVLIRYHKYTGETWLADQGQWNLLEESGATGTSEYEVVLIRADKDVKGYVAARIDRINGDTWWLKQNTWQPFVNN